MTLSAFIALMLIVVFAFIAGMIWAYRRNDYKEEKKHFETEPLNSFDITLKTISVTTEKNAEEEPVKTEEGKDETQNPLTEIELESRKKMIQKKNHIKKSAADEYFEKTRKMANEILKPKT